jgi:hypothetical protein
MVPERLQNAGCVWLQCLDSCRSNELSIPPSDSDLWGDITGRTVGDSSPTLLFFMLNPNEGDYRLDAEFKKAMSKMDSAQEHIIHVYGIRNRPESYPDNSIYIDTDRDFTRLRTDFPMFTLHFCTFNDASHKPSIAVTKWVREHEYTNFLRLCYVVDVSMQTMPKTTTH